MQHAHRIFRLAGIAGGALIAVMVVTSALAQGTWAVLAPVPALTEGMAVAQVGNKIIAAYGFSGADTNLTRIYDIDANAWSAGAAAPLPVRSEGAGIAQGGFFYAVGGRESGVSVLSDFERYDPVAGTWVSLPNMPTARAGLAVARVGDAIYALGGRTGTTPCTGTPLDAVERFDTLGGTWSAVAPLPAPRSDLAAAEMGGKIYVFGGCNEAGVLGNVDVYDPVADTWSTAPADLPTPRASLYAVGWKGNTVYVFGGWDGTVQLSVNEAYKVSANSWSPALSMPTARAEMGAASHGGRIYAVGGGIFGISTDANEAFKPEP